MYGNINYWGKELGGRKKHDGIGILYKSTYFKELDHFAIEMYIFFIGIIPIQVY